MLIMQTRRRFLTTASMAGAAGLFHAPPSQAAEGALETTTVRIAKLEAICLAPQYASAELLRAEGFTEIHYVEVPPTAIPQATGRGEADFSTSLAVDLIQAIDAGAPIVGLDGVHVGCYELFAKPTVGRLTDLKGKRVAADDPTLFKLIAAQVGLDPAKTSIGSRAPTPRSTRSSCLRKGRSTPTSVFRRTRRNCAPGRSDSDRQHRDRPAVGAVFLLHADWQPRLCPQSPGGDQARDARDPEGCRSLCERARAHPAADRRWRLHRELRLCAADSEGPSVRQMA
jgi:hypothetical protein